MLGQVRVLCDILDDAELYLRHRQMLLPKIVMEDKNASISQSDESPGPILDSYLLSQTEQSPLPYKEKSRSESQLQRLVTCFPPCVDDLLARVRVEFFKLRNSNMSRKDMILYLDIKRQKWQSRRMVSFWQGVLHTIEYVC